MHPSYVFEAVDFKGRIVRMSLATYNAHVPRHPEIRDHIEEAKQVIREPEIVIIAENGGYFYYKSGLGRGKWRRCYLQVLVFYHLRGEKEEGVVASFWFTTSLVRGKRIR